MKARSATLNDRAEPETGPDGHGHEGYRGSGARLIVVEKLTASLDEGVDGPVRVASGDVVVYLLSCRRQEMSIYRFRACMFVSTRRDPTVSGTLIR